MMQQIGKRHKALHEGLLTKQSFNCCSREEIGALITLLDVFRVLGSFLSLFVDTINLGEATLTQGARIFAFRPFFNTSKTKTMITTVNL
jgi:hypothetical protein